MPYDNTEGWSGSEASQQRAKREQPKTAPNRRTRILRTLRRAGTHGATWKEISDILQVHHGSSTGSLTRLHRDEQINRLTELRDGCSIYVLPEHVNGRPTTPYQPHKRNPDRALLTALTAWTLKPSLDLAETQARQEVADILKEHT